VSPWRWFLPQSPDVLRMLRSQAAITVEAMDALVAWTEGDEEAAERVRACERRGEDCKRDVRSALTDAFTTELEPEDLFELSRGLDHLLMDAKDTVREAEVIGATPDSAMRDMAVALAAGTREVARALDELAAGRRTEATAAADAATERRRDLERAYRVAMPALVEEENLRALAARRELYRRLVRAGSRMVDVAERVWYSVLKER
jgi:uncharacterized protein Yka (UPF0111/DUF47 family)